MTDDQELSMPTDDDALTAVCPTEQPEMSDAEFENYVASLPKMSNSQVRRYMKLMSRHKPGREEVKAKRKIKNRAKNKIARKQRKANRK